MDEEGITTIPEAFSPNIANDILGIRLICLYKTELQELCDWVEANFTIEGKKVYLWDGIGDMQPSREELQRTLQTGYTSIHYVARIKEPLVSTDFRGNPASSIVDALSTMVIVGNMVKVLAWYDNEWGYSCRLGDLISYIVDRGL